jgi:hypothetical protein
MDVISALMDKYQVNEQPTLLREDVALSNHFNVKHHRKSSARKDFSIHEKLYPYQESQVTEHLVAKGSTITEVEEDEPEQYIKKIYAKGGNSHGEYHGLMQYPAQQSKKSLKSNSTIEAQTHQHHGILRREAPGNPENEGKSHRMAFMMNNLKCGNF